MHTTMLRGSALAGHDPDVTAEHLVAHELAHIHLHSYDEREVETQALTWIKAARKASALTQMAGVR